MIDWLLNEFPTWFATGLYHILDLDGYDHMLFLWCLCIRYTLNSWKSVIVLVSAFTLGHCITLVACSTGYLTLPATWVELSIAITIFISAILPFLKAIGNSTNISFSMLSAIEKTSKSYYLMALVFGFIHGMGFSNLLIELLGKESDVAGPLFAFNVGIEFGQLLYVLAILSIASFLQSIKTSFYSTFITVSLFIGILLSLPMIVERVITLTV
jgi:hypothetical protein